MRKIKSMACILLLVLLVPAILHARGILPIDNRPLVEAKYGGWAGVLRLWICEGWPVGSDSTSGWINRCITAFEKRHPGVYVQPEYVEPEAIASIGESGILPPDLVLFPPGAGVPVEMLAPLPADLPLRPGLAACGVAAGERRAAPVLLGGYMWAWNAALLSGIPPTWENAETPMACPPDEPFRHWGAALLGLCDVAYTNDAPSASPTPPGDLDLGLAAAPTTPAPMPVATPVPETGLRECRLPEGFDTSDRAWQGFINGDVAAIPVTQREIRRLGTLSDQGRGPAWQLSPGGAVFTDQVLYTGIVRRESDDGRGALCDAFVEHLLSAECQGQLYRIGTFSVTDAPSGYAAGDPLAAMETMLRGSAPIMPDAFDVSWQSDTDTIVRDFFAGRGSTRKLWRKLGGILAQKPEH